MSKVAKKAVEKHLMKKGEDSGSLSAEEMGKAAGELRAKDRVITFEEYANRIPVHKEPAGEEHSWVTPASQPLSSEAPILETRPMVTVDQIIEARGKRKALFEALKNIMIATYGTVPAELQGDIEKLEEAL